MFVWQLGTRAKVDGMRKYFSDTPIDNFRVGLNVDWRLWVMGVVTRLQFHQRLPSKIPA